MGLEPELDQVDSYIDASPRISKELKLEPGPVPDIAKTTIKPKSEPGVVLEL